MATLDKSKPYGEVCGPVPYKYEQDNKFFDAQGNEVDAMGKRTNSKDPAPIVQHDQDDNLTVPEIKAALDELNVDYGKTEKRESLLDKLKAAS